MQSSTSASKTLEIDEAFLRTEFIAEDQLITITPMVRSGVVSLICGNFGPFEPSITTTVPLWLALALKKVHRCRIVPPRWLNATMLSSFIRYEKENEGNLHDIPFYLFEISSLLLHHAADDVDDAPQLRRFVEDLSNVRDSKMRRWTQANVRDRVNAIKINNLTLHEINVHRPTLTQILNNLYTIHVDSEQSGVLSESARGTASSTAPSSDGNQQQPVVGRQLRRVLRR